MKISNLLTGIVFALCVAFLGSLCWFCWAVIATGSLVDFLLFLIPAGLGSGIVIITLEAFLCYLPEEKLFDRKFVAIVAWLTFLMASHAIMAIQMQPIRDAFMTGATPEQAKVIERYLPAGSRFDPNDVQTGDILTARNHLLYEKGYIWWGHYWQHSIDGNEAHSFYIWAPALRISKPDVAKVHDTPHKREGGW